MEITTEKTADLLIARLRGRLDSTWCPAVRDALAGYVKAGEHRIQLDMGAVDYISSTGLRVLLATFKQLKAVNGRFSISPASPAVTDTLSLAGMDMLLAPAPVAAPSISPVNASAGAPALAPAAPVGQPFSTSGLRGELFTLPAGPALAVRLVEPVPTAGSLAFPAGTFGLGVGALGVTVDDCEGRRGEFIAAGGCAAYQPTDGANRPDFTVSEGALIPQARLLSGLTGTGDFTRLLRFDAPPEARTVSLTALAAAVLHIAGTGSAAFVAVTETAGLVGAALRRDPTLPDTGGAGGRFAFPEIRDWLSFTGERSFRDTTTLLVGVVARPGAAGALAPQLRPLSPAADAPVGHVHALIVPYRPLQKGYMELAPMVSALFDGAPPQALLHLLGDPRGLSGAGESDFNRGAVWLAPFTP
ncbi:MAG: anti-sigma factor antagonist [Rariglobus sp.]|jgi:anti-anti-sigma factor|nr:anti-sigma factor antagonist [Rariglobus sp.]